MMWGLKINNKFMDINEFNKLKIEMHSFYKELGEIYSPAFKSKIVFNANGFHHLRYDNNRSERPKIVQVHKLRFLKEAINILKKATTIQEYRRIDFKMKNHNDQEEGKVIEWFAFWAIISFKRKIRIKIVIKRLDGVNGKFCFWSLMPYWNLRHGERYISSDLENE